MEAKVEVGMEAEAVAVGAGGGTEDLAGKEEIIELEMFL